MKKLMMLCMVLIATCVLVSTAAACCAEPLTQGYWKTHSINGPAPYDATWACVGEDTEFFNTGSTYYEVLTTPGEDGNAYYILAHQWIAATLNLENGVCKSQTVSDAYCHGYNLLNNCYYREMLDIPKGSEDRELAIEYASILDKFNNGEY